MAALRQQVLALCEQKRALTHSAILTHFGRVSPEAVTEAVSELMQMGEIAGSQQGNDVLYVRLSLEQTQALEDLSAEELAILHTVREASTTGIWNQDLGRRIGLSTSAVNRILASLENKKLVKSVKSVHHKNRKNWLLYELTPSEETAGNFLFQGQEEFNSEFLQNLMSYTKAALQKAPNTAKGLVSVLAQQTKQQLTAENVEQVLRMMESLNQVERTDSGTYRAISWTVPEPPPVPCLLCPLARECHPTAIINPQSCKYMTEWLKPSHES